MAGAGGGAVDPTSMAAPAHTAADATSVAASTQIVRLFTVSSSPRGCEASIGRVAAGTRRGIRHRALAALGVSTDDP